MSRVGADPWGFDEDRQALARRLRDRRLVLSLGRGGALLGLALGLLAGGALAVRNWATSVVPTGWAEVALFLLVLYAAASLLGLPFAYVSGYRWERAAGLTERTVRSWLRDWSVSAGLGLGATLLAGEVLVWLLDRAPAWWWLLAWGLAVLASFVLGFLAPVLLVPLFVRSRPLRDPDLRARFEGLADRAGVPVLGAFELGASAKTRRSNAGVMGYGRTRRIVVTDTVLVDYTPREIDAILAHELAHEKFRDSWTGYALSAGTSFLLLWALSVLYEATYDRFGLASLADPAGLVVLAFFAAVLAALVSPLDLYASRRRERRADRFALRLTADPEAFASAIVKLHDKNLGVAHPRRWEVWLLYSHPPGRERVELARTFRPSG